MTVINLPNLSGLVRSQTWPALTEVLGRRRIGEALVFSEVTLPEDTRTLHFPSLNFRGARDLNAAA